MKNAKFDKIKEAYQVYADHNNKRYFLGWFKDEEGETFNCNNALIYGTKALQKLDAILSDKYLTKIDKQRNTISDLKERLEVFECKKKKANHVYYLKRNQERIRQKIEKLNEELLDIENDNIAME